MIPMSLYVSLEFIKAFQAKFMEWDNEMMYNGRHMRAITSNLNEDLAQVDIIFSDKTGTLTSNIMKFYKCTIGTTVEHDEKANPGELGKKLRSFTSKENVKGNEREYILNFLMCLCTCNTIVPDTASDGMHVNRIFFYNHRYNNVWRSK